MKRICQPTDRQRFLRTSLGVALLFLAALGTSAAVTTEGYRVATPGYSYQFPRDHGNHPEFKIEWWYLTGHLFADSGQRRFGYQATFFRRAVRPKTNDTPATPLTFGNNHVYLAHMAIIDPETQSFVYEERLNRDGWDAASAADTLDTFNGNWALKFRPEAEHPEAMLLTGSVRAEAQFRLQLTPSKPKVLFGTDGVSRKGADPTAASHYITFTRLATEGQLTFRGETLRVQGETWMDHEISSSQLDANQIGWDWASLQLNDNTEVMIYVMRQTDGSIDPHSTINWIDSDSKVTTAGPDTFQWESIRQWKSPHSGAAYPIGSKLRATHPQTGQAHTFEFRPVAEDQELQGELGGIRYWEGACDVFDETGQAIGRAYVELTGYDGKLRSRLR